MPKKSTIKKTQTKSKSNRKRSTRPSAKRRKPQDRSQPNPNHETWGLKLPRGWVKDWLKPAAQRQKLQLAPWGRKVLIAAAARALGKKVPRIPAFPRGRKSPYTKAAAAAGLTVPQWRARELARASGA